MLRNYARSNRYFPPCALFLMWVMFQYSIQPNPILDSLTVTAVLLLFISAWVNYSFFETEDSVQEHITILQIGSVKKYLLCKIAASLLVSFLLSLFAVLYPLLFNKLDGEVTISNLSMGWIAHMEFALLGTAIAALFNSRLVANTGTALGCIIIILIVSLGQGAILHLLPSGWSFIQWLLPPVYPIVQYMANMETYSSLQGLFFFVYPLLYAVILIVVYARLMKNRM
ncbi:hypothetical protein [Paenibacillus marinisediminis]